MHQWDKKQEFLNEVSSPADVKNLSVPELKKLAEEIRRFILGSVSKTGGHLASNLGMVELTLAMHYVFDFKHDKLLWDVGHQCYAHKIITGRKEKFKDLRRVEGISGFPNPAESEYDQFSVGHAGTSIATAIGMALGQKQQDQDDRVVAVVGDASIVNGASFEALNNLGLVKRQLLIVLNDNSMAIDVTVGAMAKYFSKVRLSHTYDDLRKTTKNILEHLPLGKSVEEAIERIKKGIRMTLPPSQMFESLNIPYFGPVDGHDVGSLIQLFEALADVNHPVLLHAYTKKGKGFEPADQGPSKFHSTGPFKMNGDSVESESALDTRRSFTSVFGEHLTELAQKDNRVVAITSAMCDGTGLVEFSKKFEDRFYDVGIAESAAVDIAAGLARSGLRPVVCIYSTFLQRGFDQIFQEVALQNLPVIFCIDRAGLVGSDGPTHHGIMDIGFLRLIPNMILTAPANDIEMKGALEFALSQNQPVVIRYPKDFVPEQKYVRTACTKPFVLGKSVLVKRSKKSTAVIVSYGSMLTEALKAAEMLSEEGIAADVINGRFAGPVDEKIVSGPEKGKVVITVEDHALACGFGSAVLELAAAKNRSIKAIRVLGTPGRFIGHDSRSQQLMEAGINADKIVETVKEMLSVRKPKIEIRSIKQAKSAKIQKPKPGIVNV
ncbi:MAG: 1-deoxy-D-xylulose-5-phosphate synthase [Planctomycetes bacterium]|nr:1-deoxy-D-xylulose-5-phosphate synthase [Planctomycetota bacterium]